MKLVVLLALALAMTSVTLITTADEAAACIPPKCPGFGTCHLTEEEVGETQNPVTGDSTTISKPALECYY